MAVCDYSTYLSSYRYILCTVLAALVLACSHFALIQGASARKVFIVLGINLKNFFFKHIFLAISRSVKNRRKFNVKNKSADIALVSVPLDRTNGGTRNLALGRIMPQKVFSFSSVFQTVRKSQSWFGCVVGMYE